MLKAQNVTCVRGDRRLFSDISFDVPSGTLLQVTGPNGSGKTSLLRIICGLSAPETGEITWNGKKISKLGEEYARDLSYLGHRHGIKEEFSSLENLRVLSGLSGEQLDTETARASLTKIGLENREHLPARFLSEGQKRRSALARLLHTRTKLWVLDEVLASLDATAVGMIGSMIEGHLNQGGMAVVATHQELNLSAGSLQRLELS